ncbi:MAG: dTMP kinase [Candidatus Pacearchaeota archaeon]
MTGLFFVFEGIDGSGKSTQATNFTNYLFLKEKYKNVLLTREPYKELKIREILLEEDPYSNAENLTRLFVEDRRKHLNDLILPCLKKNIDVVCDRYFFSTFAYQYAQGVSFDKISELHKGILIPDMIFLIDVSPKVAFERMKKDSKRKMEKKFEQIDFIEKVRNNYHFLSKMKDFNVFVINGEKSEDEVFKQIIYFYEKFTKKKTNLNFFNHF